MGVRQSTTAGHEFAAGGHHAYAIPDDHVSDRVHTVPGAGALDPIALEREQARRLGNASDPRHRQVADTLRASQRVRDGFESSSVLPPRRTETPLNRFDERERYLLDLQEKHGVFPSAPQGFVPARRKHHRPLRREVARETLHPNAMLDNFERYRGGGYTVDQERKRVHDSRYRFTDGRMDHEGRHIESFATGANVPARQSPYEAMMSRGRAMEGLKREAEALLAKRQVLETKGREVAFQWQGPDAVHRPSAASANLGRRQVHTGSIVGGPDGTDVYQMPFDGPDATVLRPKLRTSFDIGERREVTGQAVQNDGPYFPEAIPVRQRKQNLFELRHPNPTDTTTYMGDATVLAGRRGQLETTSFRTEANPRGQFQRAIPAVPDNRATRQLRLGVDNEENRELDSGAYSGATGVSGLNYGGGELYQRHTARDQRFTKIVVQDRDPQPLRYYDQTSVLHRNVDALPFGMKRATVSHAESNLGRGQPY